MTTPIWAKTVGLRRCRREAQLAREFVIALPREAVIRAATYRACARLVDGAGGRWWILSDHKKVRSAPIKTTRSRR